MMLDKEKVIKDLEFCVNGHFKVELSLATKILALLKEQENEYENGFNDAMLGKQELMYEGIDGKWHKKDW